MIQDPEILKPKRPAGPGWKRMPRSVLAPQLLALGYQCEPWLHENGLFCISAIEVASEPGEVQLGPEYHLSVSASGQRCSSSAALWVLAQFELLDAKEDNHVPGGVVRNFWRPVADHLAGYECRCVDDEPAMIEDKGDFVWRGVTR